MVTFWNHDDAASNRWRSRRELRRGGLRVDVYPEADKLGKQFKYASSRNVPFVAILGDDERARGEVAIEGPANAANRRASRVARRRLHQARSAARAVRPQP